MITAVDSSVLFDLLKPGQAWATASAAALKSAFDEGQVVACEAVWAECGAGTLDSLAFDAAMARLGVQFLPMTQASAVRAAELWRSDRLAGGRRDRIAADFLIGAHALVQADRLLTRDDGFYREHFDGLQLLVPQRREP